MLDLFIKPILFICYAVYILMGIALITMGALYWDAAGETSSTAAGLLIIGVLMLFVGGTSIFATWKAIWLALLVVELVNVALFFFLFICIMMSLIIATGTRDPVYDGVVQSWREGTHEELVTSGACGEAGAACTAWSLAATGADAPGKLCQQSLMPTAADQAWFGYNCANITAPALDASANITAAALDVQGALVDSCASLAASCTACDAQCQQVAVQNIKDYIVPAAITCLCVVFFLFVAVSANTILVNSDTSTNEGNAMYIGLAVNGFLMVSGLALAIIGLVGMSNASDACPTGQDCTSWASLSVIVLAIFIFITSAIATFGIYIDNSLLIRVADVFLILFGFVLLLAGIVLGMASGTMMDDVNKTYDENYPEIRRSVEVAEPEFCQIPKDQCVDLTAGVYDAAGGWNPCDTADADKDVCLGARITSATLWAEMQFKAVQPLIVDTPEIRAIVNISASCATTDICITCSPMMDNLADSRWNALSTAAVSLGDGDRGAARDQTITFDNSQTWTPGDMDGCGTAAQCRSFATGAEDGALSCSLDRSDLCSDLTGSANGTWAWANAVHNLSLVATALPESSMPNFPAVVASMGRCQLSLADYESDTAKCLEASTESCHACASGFSFADNTLGNLFKTQTCLEFTLDHMETSCPTGVADKSATCHAAVVANHATFAAAAQICQYTDSACKAKLEVKTMNEMKSIGTVGVFFLIFFMVIIYFTYAGVNVMRGGGDGGDSDDEDD